MRIRVLSTAAAFGLGLVVAGPNAFGQVPDLVYTALTPCRVVDTRLSAAGPLTGGVTRTFDLDSGHLAEQGGTAAGCGIPAGVAQAVEMTIVAVDPARDGFFTVWALGAPPAASVLNYAAHAVVATTAIVPVHAGDGDDVSLLSLANTHVVIDVLGYFAPKAATRPDCITVMSDAVLVPVGVPSVIIATCPTDRTATGGGFDKAEGTASLVGVWAGSAPFGNGWRSLVENQSTGDRSVRTFVKCCRVPGI